MPDKPKKKSVKTAHSTPKTPSRPKQPAREPSGFELPAEQVESALLTGESRGVLEDYFGQEGYSQLGDLAREAAARSGATIVLAHGVGSRQDLPIPFAFAVAGAATALVLSFVVLALAWREPRFDDPDRRGRGLPPWVTSTVDSPWMRWTLHIVGLLLVGFTAMAAYLAPDLATNPTAGLVFVVFWLDHPFGNQLGVTSEPFEQSLSVFDSIDRGT